MYTANTAMAEVSTPNSNLDGKTGTYATFFTAGAKGSVVKSIIIKARSFSIPCVHNFDEASKTQAVIDKFIATIS